MSIQIQVQAFDDNSSVVAVRSDATTVATSLYIICADVSYSMSAKVEAKQTAEQLAETQKESKCEFSRLNVVQHAINVFVATLDVEDIIVVYDFSNDARLVYGPETCTPDAKRACELAIKKMTLRCATNLADGYGTLLCALDTLPPAFCRDSIFFILMTDGMPSHEYAPTEGYPAHVAELKNKALTQYHATPTITSVAVGNQLDSALLDAVSDVFLHMPDGGAIGPVMVTLVSRLRSTAVIDGIAMHDSVLKLRDAKGGVHRCPMGVFPRGQTRHFYVDALVTDARVQTGKELSIPVDLIHSPPISRDSRAHAVRFTHESLFEIDRLIRDHRYDGQSAFVERWERTFAADNSWGTYGLALLKTWRTEILVGALPANRSMWGVHFFHTVRHSLREERRCNFVDEFAQAWPGQCEEELTTLADFNFAQIVPPLPSIGAVQQTMPLQFLHGGGCFSPDSLVERWDTDAFAPLRADDVKAGDLLRTASGTATVRCVTFTPCPNGKAEMVRVDALVVTPYHPIRSVHNEWIFPIDIGEKAMFELPHVVNFVLDADHELIIDKIVGVTLGHGKTDSAVVLHEYWGRDVVQDLQKSDGWTDGRVRLDPPQ